MIPRFVTLGLSDVVLWKMKCFHGPSHVFLFFFAHNTGNGALTVKRNSRLFILTINSIDFFSTNMSKQLCKNKKTACFGH